MQVSHPSTPTPLPDDIAALQGMVRELRSTLSIERALREKAESKVKDLLRRLFGPKSEKLDPNQLALALAQVEADSALATAMQPIALNPEKPAPAKKRKSGGRRPPPQNLPVETTLIDLPEDQKAGLVKIREEITIEHEYQQSRFFLHKIIRPVYADPAKVLAPRVAELPPRVIPQSGVGPGLLAHLLVSKYVDHLPLNRLQQIAARSGLDLPRQKQCRWVEDCAHLLLTVHHQLKARILGSGYVQVDETPVRVMDPDRGGRVAQAYLWTYHAPNAQAILFDFNLSRGRDSPESFFPKEWTGVLQSDGYELYAALIRERKNIVHIGCMAHLRRYVVEAIDGGGETVAQLLADIGMLYGLEKKAREANLTAEQRACLRHARARSVLRDLQKRFAALSQSELPSSPLGKAASYAVNHWPQIARYAKAAYGHVHIDNNAVERGIRPTKLGMKNWIFIGHPQAGWRSAVMYSIAGSCKLLGVNPESYLRWVLPKLAAAGNRAVANLLPHDFAALQARSNS